MSVDWDWTRVVVDHVHIRVRDAQASVAFYKAALAPLGIPPLWESERGAQLANLVVTDGEPHTSGPVHIAFVADSREQVEAFHRAGLGPAAATTASRACGSSTAPMTAGATTPPSCSTPTGTISRPSGVSLDG